MTLPSETRSPNLALPLTTKPAHQATAMDGFWLIHDAGGRRLAAVGPGEDAERRAKEMVAACNASPALVDALQFVQRWLDGGKTPDGWIKGHGTRELREVVAGALKVAEAGS